MGVQQLNIHSAIDEAYFEQGVVKRIGTFFSRHSKRERTNGQKTFDWVFGVIMPTICFTFDPFIFRDWNGNKGLFGDYLPFAFLLSFTLVMANLAVLLFGERFKEFNIYLSGLFAVGGVVSLLIGIVLLPFSVIGLVFLIGILGFTPLLTSIVYLRNAVRTFHAAKRYFRRASLISAFVFAAAFSAAIPILANANIHPFRENMKFRGNAEFFRGY